LNYKRTFALTGASGGYGTALGDALRQRGANVMPLHYGPDWNYDNLNRCQEALTNADVLVLAHGTMMDHTMEANCTSFKNFIGTYRRLRSEQSTSSEVWALGSEIEFHPAPDIDYVRRYLESKRAYAKWASKLYWESQTGSFIYRHIVPAAFPSKMSTFGLMSARTAVRMTLYLISRDWRYVPVTYTGIAFLNYFKFRGLAK
jgi:hypothetical protein